MTPIATHAWVDESMHTATPKMPDGIYLLAATIAEATACDTTRDVLRGLLPRKATRLHWRDQTQRRRRVIADALQNLDVVHTVVIGAPLDPRRQERARRICMERLLHELCSLDVSRVWVESRTASLNRRDRQLIDVLRSRQVIPPTLRFDFAFPTDDPMLWLPDVVAGAVGAHRRGGDAQPYETLRAHIVEHEIEV